MDEVLFVFALLMLGGFVALTLLPLYLKLRELQRRHDEMAARLTSQMRAVYEATNQHRAMVERALQSAAAPSATRAATDDVAIRDVPSVVGESRESPATAAGTTPQAPESSVQPPSAPESLAPEIPGTVPTEPVQPIPEPTSAPSREPAIAAHPAAPTLAGSRPDRIRELPRVPNRFEAAAKDVLHRIWNWIIVGEEHVPKGVSVEFAVASQWLLRIGIVLLVVGVGFFLNYSIEHGFLTETTRAVLAFAVGLAMLTAGIQILGGRYHVMGQGLLGGGIATLYFSVFAAANFYKLIPLPVAFAGMIGVTALSGFIAVRFHSILTAVLGVVGGYATPIMLSTGQVNFPGLYGYMLVLGLGVLGICVWKRWPLLNYLSFAGNYLLVLGSLRDYRAELHFWQVMPFLVAFFVLFSTMVFAFNLFNRTKSNLLDVLVLYVNAAVFFSLSYWLIEKSFSEKWVAVITLSLTAFYVAHVWYCLVRRVLDRELMLSFTALAAFFLAITIPLVLSHEWITVSWAVQALVMLWVAGKLDSEFLRHVAYGLYFIVLGRFLFLDLPFQYGRQTLADLTLTEYLQQLGERLVMFGVPIGSLALGYRMLARPGQVAALAMDKTTDIRSWIESCSAARSAVFVMFGMLFLYMHLELNRTLGSLCPPLRLPMLTLLWLGVCGLLLFEFAKTGSRIVLGFLSIFATGVLLKMLLIDLPDWSATSDFLYEGPYSFFDAGFRLLDFGAIILFFAFATRLLMKQTALHAEVTQNAGTLMGIAGVGMLFLYSTLELNSFLRHYVEDLRSGGISILWTVFALAFLVRGIGRNRKTLRYAGLVLFAVVTWKVFFVDLSRLDQLYRIVAFIVLGVLVLCGSFLYLRSRQTFETPKDDDHSSGGLPERDSEDRSEIRNSANGGDSP